jgi:ubiquitin carboxyl-terminal hydrolase 40
MYQLPLSEPDDPADKW